MIEKISNFLESAFMLVGLVIGVPLGVLAIVLGAACACVVTGWRRGYRGRL